MADVPPPAERPRASGGPRPARRGPGRLVLLAVLLMLVGGVAVVAGSVNMLAAAPSAGLPPAASAPTTTTPTPTPTPTPEPEPEPTSLRLGDEGPTVLEIQQRLNDLGYWHGETDGYYGQLTRQAVMAFQKAEGLTPDGVAGPVTRSRLPEATRPQAQHDEGDLLEVDLERQLLLVVQDGQVRWVFNTSTGNGEYYSRPSGGTGIATTPRGDYEIERQINGYRRAELGLLYRPKYFNGGIAVHGSGSIPALPASHGCVRVTNSAMDLLWSSGVADMGTEVVVH